MTEKVKQFVATGARRMIVAMWAVAVIGIIHIVKDSGINDPAAYGIAVITLGYYGTKFAEAIKAFLESKKV